MERSVEPIFLLSLPRSGSTLLQRILRSHSLVSTAEEPWLLLPLLYALRPEGVYAEYDHRLAGVAIRDFCRKLPDGTMSYQREVRGLALALYQQASDPGSRYFVDKTPRYALVVEELLECFPDAPVICLWRNPLAVVASMAESWGDRRWRPYLHKVDLFDGLEALLTAYLRRPDRFVALRYEDLVTDPHATCERLFHQLGLPWEPSVVETFARTKFEGRVGDKTGARQYEGVSEEPLSKWKVALASPLRKLWCRRYLRWIGAERLAVMGYDINELLTELDDVRPDWRQAGPDAARAVKGAVHNLVEPRIVKQKLAGRRDWRHVHNHL